MQHKSIYFPIRQSGCVGKCMNYFNSLNCPETPCSERGGGGGVRAEGGIAAPGSAAPKPAAGRAPRAASTAPLCADPHLGPPKRTSRSPAGPQCHSPGLGQAPGSAMASLH